MNLRNNKTERFSVCVNCGFDVCANESTHIDCVYPVNRERSKWNCYCNPQMGGCGRVVYAASTSELLRKWDDGETSEIII